MSRSTIPWPISLSPDALDLARDFVFQKWCERAGERLLPMPDDLSGSCKFSSLFCAEVFGLKMRGNADHQFCIDEQGSIVDLNAGAADVSRLSDPWRHDPIFWNNRDHRASMQSCRPRVALWLQEFALQLSPHEPVSSALCP